MTTSDMISKYLVNWKETKKNEEKKHLKEDEKNVKRNVSLLKGTTEEETNWYILHLNKIISFNWIELKTAMKSYI